MGSLSDLVGDLTDLEPPLTVNPGTVLLTFRHGAPVGVIHPGKKLRRGRGLPLTMAPQGVPVSTADVPIDVNIENIGLPGAYNLPRLEARVIIRVDDRDGYSGLKEYVRRKGLNFAEVLDGEVHNELDKAFRNKVGQHEHTALFQMGNLSEIVRLNSPLLKGLFRIESIQKVEPTWHPEFVRSQEAAAEKAREAAELDLQHEALELHRQLAEDEDRLLQDRASRRGLSIVELESPELVQQAGQQQHELNLALIQNADALRRAGNGDIISAAMRLATGDQLSGIAAASIEVSANVSPSTEPLDRLKRDATLLRLWRKAGLPGEPVGIGIGDSVILAVCDGPAPVGLKSDLDDKIAPLVDAREAITISEASDVADVIRRYLVARVPELAASDIFMSVTSSGVRLLVDLTSSTTRLSPLLGMIRDPARDVLAPLQAVIPYDAIDVTIAGNG